MAELLLELFCEEIPARLQLKAAADLQRLVTDGLAKAGLMAGAARAYVTPRRLALVIEDVASGSEPVSEEKKGPRVGAPDAAVQGFLRAAGLASITDAEVVADARKGDYYVARLHRPGRDAAAIIADAVTDAVAKFPWPKAMRWGVGAGTWIRPLRGVVCLLGGRVVPFDVLGVPAGDETCGHRFHAPAPFQVTGFHDYRSKLEAANVRIDASEREAVILEEARALAQRAGLTLNEDDGLVAENAGLTEWPVVLMGSFNSDYLDVPAECLMSAMRAHQKCFSLKDAKGRLANTFILVSNLVAEDGGAGIIAGNERVIDARLADAKFFWEQDKKRPLDEMASQLEGITFHEGLGSQKDRVERIADLAHRIAPLVDADPALARRAGQLCKADLVSGMVGEFPELQGLMGRYYAQSSGTKPEIARAIELHYKPKGPTDSVPLASSGDELAIAVALADKLDTLVGFWAIDEKPTGSGDPYQLRRAALGVIRIVLENDLRLPLTKLMVEHGRVVSGIIRRADPDVADQLVEKINGEKMSDLLHFFADRLKVHLKDGGLRHDLIDAVFALPGQDDLALVVKRVEALDAFLASDDGANVLAGAKRAVNILSLEEKKDKTAYTGAPAGRLLQEPAEKGLSAAIAKVTFDVDAAINVENFDGAMRALAELRGPVDKFFEDVTVNVPDQDVRANRLRLLAQIRATTQKIADFGRIAG